MSLEEDKDTGYLTNTGHYELTGFNADVKLKFLELYESTPNMSKVAKALKIHPRTVMQHMQKDKKFREDFLTLREAVCDDLEEAMIEHAKGKSGFMDRAMYLKAHRAKFRETVQHEHNMNKGVVDKYLEAANDMEIVDAEFTEED